VPLAARLGRSAAASAGRIGQSATSPRPAPAVSRIALPVTSTPAPCATARCRAERLAQREKLRPGTRASRASRSPGPRSPRSDRARPAAGCRQRQQFVHLVSTCSSRSRAALIGCGSARQQVSCSRVAPCAARSNPSAPAAPAARPRHLRARADLLARVLRAQLRLQRGPAHRDTAPAAPARQARPDPHARAVVSGGVTSVLRGPGKCCGNVAHWPRWRIAQRPHRGWPPIASSTCAADGRNLAPRRSGPAMPARCARASTAPALGARPSHRALRKLPSSRHPSELVTTDTARSPAPGSRRARRAAPARSGPAR